MVFSFQAGLACACASGLGRECLSCPVSRSLPTPFLPPLPGVGSGPPGKEKEKRKKDGWGAVPGRARDPVCCDDRWPFVPTREEHWGSLGSPGQSGERAGSSRGWFSMA